MADKKAPSGPKRSTTSAQTAARKKSANTQAADKKSAGKKSVASTGAGDKTASAKASGATAQTPKTGAKTPARRGAAAKPASAQTSKEAADKSGATSSAAPSPQTAPGAAVPASATEASTEKTSIPKTSTTSGGSSRSSSEGKNTSRPEPRPASPAPKTTEPRKGGFAALFLGGVCAAIVGFVAAWYILPQTGLLTRDTGKEDELAQRVEAQADEIETLKAQLDGLPAPAETDLSGIEAGQQDMDDRLASLSDEVASLGERLDSVEARPAPDGDGGASASQLAALRQTVEEQGERLDALADEAASREEAAEDAAQQDLRRSAASRIRTALDSGSGFAPAISDLEDTGMDVPEDLREAADAGVPTRAELQDSFAPAARAAIDASRGADASGEGGGFWSFMSEQLGARSLERKEGPGTDAVLSRAEDDLRQGKLASALDEIDALPDPARAALSDWAGRARTRLQALSAYDALDAQLN